MSENHSAKPNIIIVFIVSYNLGFYVRRFQMELERQELEAHKMAKRSSQLESHATQLEGGRQELASLSQQIQADQVWASANGS